MTDDLDALNEELAEVWVERYLKQVQVSESQAEALRRIAWEEPGEAAGSLLGGYVVGAWDLTDQELSRLWLIGRLVGGYTPEELVSPRILAEAAPGRGTWPADPEGYELVQPALLEGGGHGAGRAKPGKREFPSTWTEDDTIRHTMAVARHPSLTVQLPSGDFRAAGDRGGVRMSVLVAPTGHVLTSYPIAGEGVAQNPLDDVRIPHVERLRSLLDELVAPSDQEPRRSLDELMAVGEWPHVIRNLRALEQPLSSEQREALEDLAKRTQLWRGISPTSRAL